MSVVTKSDVVAWADGLIAGQKSVPVQLLDVSLAANEDVRTIESKLRDFPGDWSPAAAALSVMDCLGRAFEAGTISPLAAAHSLLVWATKVDVGQDSRTAAMVPSWVAEEIPFGYTSEQDVAESIRECLAPFTRMKANPCDMP